MDDIHDLTVAYALDALDPHEVEAFEAHLARCEECRTALAALGDTAAALAWGVEAPEPPARLRAAILERAAGERRNVVPLPVRRSALFRVTAGVAAVAACAAIVLAVVVATSSKRAQCAAGWRCSAVADGRGLVSVDPSGQGVIVLRRLSRAPAGKTYEAWVIQGGAARRAGLFAGGGATTVVRLARPVPPGAVVAATIERVGGVQAPTTPPVFSVRA
jgi:anti-sigma-K factor RskA